MNTEILKAAGVDANSAFAHRQFGDLMMAFHQHAKSTFSDAEVCSTTRILPPPSQPPSLVAIDLKLLAYSCSFALNNMQLAVMHACTTFQYISVPCQYELTSQYNARTGFVFLVCEESTHAGDAFNELLLKHAGCYTHSNSALHCSESTRLLVVG